MHSALSWGLFWDQENCLFSILWKRSLSPNELTNTFISTSSSASSRLKIQQCEASEDALSQRLNRGIQESESHFPTDGLITEGWMWPQTSSTIDWLRCRPSTPVFMGIRTTNRRVLGEARCSGVPSWSTCSCLYVLPSPETSQVELKSISFATIGYSW